VREHPSPAERPHRRPRDPIGRIGDARTGQLEPALVLPSGYYKWDLEDIRRQLRELRERNTDT
jgi:hypothetical protein